jgi:hypothetical protein
MQRQDLPVANDMQMERDGGGHGDKSGSSKNRKHKKHVSEHHQTAWNWVWLLVSALVFIFIVVIIIRLFCHHKSNRDDCKNSNPCLPHQVPPCHSPCAYSDSDNEDC